MSKDNSKDQKVTGNVEIECVVCGTTYERHHSRAENSKWCSRECRAGDESEKVRQECVDCGEVMHRKPSQVAKTPRCGDCWQAWKDGATVETECGYCGASLTRKRNRVEKFEVSFCDSSCGMSWVHENRQLDPWDGKTHPWEGADHSGPNNPNWKGGLIEIECIQCGTTKELKQHKENQLFCSMACHDVWRRENGTMSGPNSPNWKGGEFPYGEGWNEAKREAARERDGRRCQSCGRDEKTHLEEFGCKNPVHHIIDARAFAEDDSSKNDMENLVTLCRKCHYKWEGIPLRPSFAE